MLLVDLLEGVGGLARLSGVEERQTLIVEKVGRIGSRLLRLPAHAETAGEHKAHNRNSDERRRKAAEGCDGMAVLHEALPGFAGGPERRDIRRGLNLQAVHHRMMAWL
jgi:hypothetical protein